MGYGERSILTARSPARPSGGYPDGPEGSLILGNFRGLQRDPLGYLLEASRSYGDLIHFRVFRQHIYMVNSPELIEQLLVAEAKRTIKPRLLRFAKETLGDGLLTSEGDFWRRQRRLAQPAFHRKEIEGYAKIMVDTTDEIVGEWRDGATIDVHAEMMRLTLEIVSRSLFGEQIGRERTREVGEILDILLQRFLSYVTLTYTFFDWFPRPSKIRFKRALRRLDEIIMEIVADHRAVLERGEDDPTLIGTYLRAVDDRGERMTDRQLRDEVVTLFLAGHETTASAMTFTIYLLSRNPDKRELLEAEVDQVLGNRAPTFSDIEHLTYTRSVVLESMRLYPPAWRVGREAIEDIQLGGWTIPTGSQLLAAQWTMHRSPVYYDSAEQFQPERWSREGIEDLPRYAYFPFGGGPRMCIGARFAETEATLILTKIVQRLRLECRQPVTISLLPSITLRPRDPVNVVVQRREIG